MSDDFEAVLEKDSELLGSDAVAFVHGCLDANGGVATILASRGGELTYEQEITILAALIGQTETGTDRSADQIFRDLVAERNQMASNQGERE